MERILSKLGHDWWSETHTRDMNLKKRFTIVLFAVRRQPEVCCLCLVTAIENVSVQFVFWSLGPLSKICLLQKRLPLSAVKSKVIFPRTLWSLMSVQLWLSKLREQYFEFFIIHSMHSLKDTQFWLCYFLFIVPAVKNDLRLCVNHQLIAPSLYNQITQLIFITDIFRPRIKCTTRVQRFLAARFVCAKSVVFCQNFWQITQQLPGN